MFANFSRSWSLLKASATVLRADKELLLFPVLSGLATLLVMASFALPIVGLRLYETMDRGILSYTLGFLFYLCQYTVMFFFNTALVGAAMIRLRGGDPTLGDGLRIAREKFTVILGYALIASTVGMVLQAIEERVGFLGKIIVGLIGMAWTLATFLVVPVLVAQNVGPIEAVKGSAALLKRTWGENIIGNAGIGLITGLTVVLVLLGGVASVVLATQVSALLAFAMAGLTMLILLFLFVVQNALTGIYAAALYRYAAEGQTSEGFDGATLQGAFKPKG